MADADTLPQASESTALAVTETLVPAVAYAEGNIERILQGIERKVRATETDISTAAGRKAVASLAYQIARTKTALDGAGKQLTDQHRKVTEKIHADRRLVVSRLDALAAEARAPLTRWEQAEERRVADHEAALAAIPEAAGYGQAETSAELAARLEALRNPPARDWQEFSKRAADAYAAEIVRTEHLHADAVEVERCRAELARLQAEEEQRARDEAARLQAEREARIAAEAAERAKREAEAKAERERQESERRAAAERQRIEDEARAQAERDEAERRRIEAEAAAAAARAAAEQARVERERQAAEERAARAERDKAAAEERAERERVAAAERADREKAEAVAAEQRRQAEAQAAAEREAQRRADDQAHRREINRKVLAALMEDAGLSQATARKVVESIARGAIPHCAIQY